MAPTTTVVAILTILCTTFLIWSWIIMRNNPPK